MDLNSRQAIMVQRTDFGLRSFLNKVYGYMSGGLVLSALTAFLATKPAIFNMLYHFNAAGEASLTILGWIVLLAPLGLVFLMGGAIRSANTQLANTLFWAFSALIGLSFGDIFLVYTAASLAQTFLITAGSFLALSLIGHTMKRDLSGFGSFLTMGLVGLILASLANIFFKSSTASFYMSVIGVFLFAGFTVYDSNRLKEMYASAETDKLRETLAIFGALSLYLDFINLFQFLLSFLGDRR